MRRITYTCPDIIDPFATDTLIDRNSTGGTGEIWRDMQGTGWGPTLFNNRAWASMDDPANSALLNPLVVQEPSSNSTSHEFSTSAQFLAQFLGSGGFEMGYPSNTASSLYPNTSAMMDSCTLTGASQVDDRARAPELSMAGPIVTEDQTSEHVDKEKHPQMAVPEGSCDVEAMRDVRRA